VSHARINADRRAIVGLVRNLLDNAVRHATSTVTVTLIPDNDHVDVIVDGDGPGIPWISARASSTGSPASTTDDHTTPAARGSASRLPQPPPTPKAATSPPTMHPAAEPGSTSFSPPIPQTDPPRRDDRPRCLQIVLVALRHGRPVCGGGRAPEISQVFRSGAAGAAWC
jgi:hypothetical protein